MNVDTSIISYFLHASAVVQGVMLVLLFASICSCAFILEREFSLRDSRRSTMRFERTFWSGEDLSKLYAEGAQRKTRLSGVETVFHAGFKEFLRFRKQAGASLSLVMENTKRAMRVAQMREQDKLEGRLTFLAIVGSISPYVGLFGTVWGIMQAFRALSTVEQATIAMVAPGIAEALVATALGLFAAIPAVIAYNRFTAEIGRLMVRFDTFQEEFTNILIRQSQHATSQSEAMESA